MKKKIAIAVDGSNAAIDALSYAAMLSNHYPEMFFVLVFIQPSISQYFLDDAKKNPEARRILDKLGIANSRAALHTLETHQKRMLTLGIAGDHVEIKTQSRRVGVADDLLALCEADRYDALVVGRRGISQIQRWITGSVATNLVEHSRLIPIWVVDGKVSSRKILIAVDGSQGSLRALDHLCFILDGAGEPEIHLMHVQPMFSDYCPIDLDQEIADGARELILTDNRRCMDDFFSQALKTLQTYGFTESRIHFQTHVKCLSTAHSIVTEAEKGGFGTVVLGRRGKSSSLFTGSVGRKVLHKITDKAVWIVP